MTAPAHPAGFDWSRLDRVTADDPLRVLFSACLRGPRDGLGGRRVPRAAGRAAGGAKPWYREYFADGPVGIKLGDQYPSTGNSKG